MHRALRVIGDYLFFSLKGNQRKWLVRTLACDANLAKGYLSKKLPELSSYAYHFSGESLVGVGKMDPVDLIFEELKRRFANEIRCLKMEALFP